MCLGIKDEQHFFLNFILRILFVICYFTPIP